MRLQFFHILLGDPHCQNWSIVSLTCQSLALDDEQTSLNVLEYAQLDEQIKSLEKKKEGLRETFLGVTGVTTTGYEIKWSTVQSNTVDREAVEKALGFVPTKQGKESTRLSIRKTGGR